MELTQALGRLRHLSRATTDPTAREALEVVTQRMRDQQARIEELQTMIRDYVAQVESGERFDALVASVPGLQSDDGVYPVSR